MTRHDTTDYRERIRLDVQDRREHRGKAAPPATIEKPRPAITETRPKVVPPATVEQPRPAITETRPPVRTDDRDVYRGRDVQKLKPASGSGYGGYGTGRDATTYRERGKTSRENMLQFNRPSTKQQPAISGGRQSVPAPSGRQMQPGGRDIRQQFNRPAPQQQKPATSGGRQSAPAPGRQGQPGGGFKRQR